MQIKEMRFSSYLIADSFIISESLYRYKKWLVKYTEVMNQIKLVSLDFLFKLFSSSPYGNVNLTTLNMPEVNEFFGVR